VLVYGVEVLRSMACCARVSCEAVDESVEPLTLLVLGLLFADDEEVPSTLDKATVRTHQLQR